MAAFYRKIQLEIKIAVNNYFLIVFDSGLFEEFDLFAVVFSAVKYSRWRPRWQQQQGGESYGFCYDTLHGKIIFGNVFCLCSGNRIHQSKHHFPDHFWLNSVNTISYYSHKSSYFGQTFCQKMKWYMPMYTEWAISLKIVTNWAQHTNLLLINMRKKSDGWIKVPKMRENHIYLWSAVYQQKKTWVRD